MVPITPLRVVPIQRYRQYWTFELLDVETAERTEYVRKIVAHNGAMGESSCNNVRSAISTTLLILLMMRLSCSEKFSALSESLHCVENLRDFVSDDSAVSVPSVAV